MRAGGAGAGSAFPAVTWAASRSAFNRLPAVRRYPGQTNLPFVRRRHISKHVCGNYFTAAPGSHITEAPFLPPEGGMRGALGNVYRSVDLKLIMILN